MFGLCTAFRPRSPLFYKIIFFGAASCFLGSCYEALALLLRPSVVQSFHIGWLGYVGLYFFLCSSYYGAHQQPGRQRGPGIPQVPPGGGDHRRRSAGSSGWPGSSGAGSSPF